MSWRLDRSIARWRASKATLLVVLLTVGDASSADSAALQAMPVPGDVVRQTVALDMVRDGRTLSIARFDTTSSVDDVLAFYRTAWPANGDDPGHLEDSAGDWSIISRLSGDTLLTVQLAERAGVVEGVLSAASLRQSASSASAPARALPAGGQLLSTTETTDGGRHASTSVVASTARPGEVVAFYRDHLVRNGWTLVRDTVAEGTPVLLLTRSGGRLDVVVSSLGGGSVAILNEVRGDE